MELLVTLQLLVHPCSRLIKRKLESSVLVVPWWSVLRDHTRYIIALGPPLHVVIPLRLIIVILLTSLVRRADVHAATIVVTVEVIVVVIVAGNVRWLVCTRSAILYFSHCRPNVLAKRPVLAFPFVSSSSSLGRP